MAGSGNLFAVLCCLIGALGMAHSTESYPNVNFVDSGTQVSLDNGFVQVLLSLSDHSILSLSADFSGDGNFADAINVLSNPLSLEGKASGCVLKKFGDTSIESSGDGDRMSLKLSSTFACGRTKHVSESWTVSLAKGQRTIGLDINGDVVKEMSGVSYIGHGVYSRSASLYGLFDRGVAQMMNYDDHCMSASDPLPRAYMIGNGTALDVVFSADSAAASDVIIMTNHASVAAGVLNVVVGNVAGNGTSLNYDLAWKSCVKTFEALEPINVPAGTKWVVQMELVPNNFNFPALSLSDVASQPELFSENDLVTYMMGAYASPAGCLKSYYEDWQGTIAPTIAHPDTGYSPDTNFFDPDNYISLSALLYSGDDYFIEQTRLVLERTAETMCGLGSDQVAQYCNSDASHTGQLMHHFQNLVPEYTSIATSTQLGPNIFWTLTALQYTSVSGDHDWLLNTALPFIDLSTDYILNQFDPAKGLLKVQGPLWIDVLVRENYTSDSNAAVVYLFDELATMYDFVHDGDVNNERSVQLRDIRRQIINGMNQYLWNTTADDHYITQLNPDGSTRDFVDYDSNLLAVAFGVAETEERGRKILARVDSGNYTHVRGTWCCEVPYSGDAEDCYIVGGDVCGDSIVTLARIGWVDSHARKHLGDAASAAVFLDKLLVPLQQDLVDDVWLYERYDYDGNQIRTAFYFEYPSFVVMMLREIRYGIEVGINSVSINPFPAVPEGSSFRYKFGKVDVSYSSSAVTMRIPGGEGKVPRAYDVHSLLPNTAYEVAQECPAAAAAKKVHPLFTNPKVFSNRGSMPQRALAAVNDTMTVTTDSAGLLTFSMPVDNQCTVTVTLVSAE